jgi:hypothetical protein
MMLTEAQIGQATAILYQRSVERWKEAKRKEWEGEYRDMAHNVFAIAIDVLTDAEFGAFVQANSDARKGK